VVAGVAMLGDNGITERCIEAEVARKLAAYSNPDFRVPEGRGIVMGPGHQGSPNALPLPRGIDGDSPHMKSTRLAIESQAADCQIIEQGHGTAFTLEIIANGFLGFPHCTARGVERAIFAKGHLGQSVNDGGIDRLAETNFETYQLVSMSIRPFWRAVRSAQLKTRWARMRLAAVVTSSRSRTSPSERLGNIRIACEPRRLRRIDSIQ